MAEVIMDELVSNAISSRTAPAPASDPGEHEESRRRLTPVGNSKSKPIKKPLGRRLIETFIDEDFTREGLRNFIIKEIIVPSIQDALMDSVNGALGMMFGIGIVRKGASRGSDQKGDKRIRYGGFFNGGNSETAPVSKSATRTESKRRTDSSRLEVQMKDNEADAKRIMAELEELLIDYPENGVTVCDYYDAFGVSTEPTDNNWGWTDLRGMHLERCPRAFYDKESGRHLTGWAVVMPPVESLK